MRRNGRLWLRRRVYSRVECQGFFELLKNKLNTKLIKTGAEVPRLDGQHPNPINALAFNPLYDVMASACTHLCFWLPDEKFD